MDNVNKHTESFEVQMMILFAYSAPNLKQRGRSHYHHIEQMDEK